MVTLNQNELIHLLAKLVDAQVINPAMQYICTSCEETSIDGGCECENNE